MTRWHKGEAEKSWLRHATEDAKSGDREKPKERGEGAADWYSCRRKQKRNGRSCGKVPVQLISGTRATIIALNPSVSGSFCLFSLSSMGGARMKAVAMTLVVLFVTICSFCRVPLLVPLFFPPRRPYASIFFLVFVLFRPCSSSCCRLSVPLQHVCSSCSLSDLLASHYSELVSAFLVFCRIGLMPVSSSSSSCCCVGTAIICSSSARMLFFLQPFWSSCITFFRNHICCFVSFSYFSGLASFVVFSYQVRKHLTCLTLISNCACFGFSLSHSLSTEFVSL